MAVNFKDDKSSGEGQDRHITTVKIVRWRGGQHPTFEAIAAQMEQEGLRPYAASHGPNSRFSAFSYSAGKVLYCAEGSLEIILPVLNQTASLRSGDRLELPRAVRLTAIVGSRGARCIESQKP